MAFTSVSFILFMAAVLALYYLLPGKVQWLLLLAASWGFYLVGGGWTIVYLLLTTLTVYLAGRALGALNSHRRTDKVKWLKKLTVLISALLCFGLLFVLKYGGYTLRLIGVKGFEPLLPLGISFYIFQSVGYVIDCYRGKHPIEKNPLKLALFTSFFPQMVQGPIGRCHELLPQLTAPRRLNWDSLKYGIQLAMWGYFKKLIIAERAAVIVDTVMAEPSAYPGAVTAAAVFFYCIQLYCDFSGGIDIARGAAEMLGVELAENFRRPFYAVSLADYWRRWHITLGGWMRDYLFYPLTLSKPFIKLGKATRSRIPGKLGKLIPAALATFTVYFVIGIWHGASFRYIVFGLWNGVLITASFLLEGGYAAFRKRLRITDKNLPWRVFRILRTNLLVFVGRYLTRAPGLTAALSMLWATFTGFRLSDLGGVLDLGLAPSDIVITLTAMAAVLALELYQELGGRVRAGLEKRSWFIQWLGILAPLTAILLLGILLRGDYIPSAFIYQQY